MENGFINYIAGIIIVLVIAFLSQQPYFRGFGANIYNQAEMQIEALLAKGQEWVATNVSPKVESKINGEVAKAGEQAKTEIEKQKNNLMQNAWDNIKNYFANIFSKATGTKVE